MEIINKEDIEKRADIFLKGIAVSIKENIADKFYDEFDEYLDEHYTNYAGKIKRNALDELGKLYISKDKNIEDYWAKEIRKIIYIEFKDEIQNQKIKDLEAEVASLQKSLDFHIN